MRGINILSGVGVIVGIPAASIGGGEGSGTLEKQRDNDQTAATATPGTVGVSGARTQVCRFLTFTPKKSQTESVLGSRQVPEGKKCCKLKRFDFVNKTNSFPHLSKPWPENTTGRFWPLGLKLEVENLRRYLTWNTRTTPTATVSLSLICSWRKQQGVTFNHVLNHEMFPRVFMQSFNRIVLPRELYGMLQLFVKSKLNKTCVWSLKGIDSEACNDEGSCVAVIAAAPLCAESQLRTVELF